MYKLSFFVPLSHKETVKEALFEVGAGKYAHYDKCSWEVLGEGQFRALQGANPFLGEIEKIEKVQEYKVEMICNDEIIQRAVARLKEVHPYEEVAYDIIRLEIF